MADPRYDEIEQFLMPYAQARFQANENKEVLRELDKMLDQDFLGYISRIVQVFVKCILSIKDSMYLKDIVAVSIAETNLALNFPSKILMTAIDWNHVTYFPLDLKPVIETEIHSWLVYLQENSRLPGEYERYTGKYYPLVP